MEIWKDIEGYNGVYKINNKGIVKSLKFNKEKILKPLNHNQGYFYVHLHKDSKKYKLMIHRLVSISFIPNPENKPQVNHINGIKTDNRVENLEWNTAKENMNHGFDNKLIVTCKGVESGRSKLTESQVLEIRGSKLSNRKLAENYNIGKTAVGNIKQRLTWNHL